MLTPPVVLALIAWVAPSIPSAPWVLATGGLLAFACVAAEVLATAVSTPLVRARALLALPLPLGILAAVAWAGSTLPPVVAAALVTCALLGGGTLIGAVVGRAIEKPGHVLIVVVVSALVDVVSVLHPQGPTAQIVQDETAISVLLLPWPMLGTSEIVPVLGVGDVTFAALYVVAARRFGLSVRRTVVALSMAFAATLAVLLVAQIGVPALPFLGVAMLAAHPEARRLPREDRVKAAMGLLLIVAALAALIVLRS